MGRDRGTVQSSPGGEGGSEQQRFGRYEVKRLLGEGATGQVLACHDPLLDRPVALKVLHPGLPDGTREQVLERFRVELRVFGRVSHPHVVAVYDACLEGDRPYLVMECCSGPNLADWLRRQGPMSPGQGALIFHQAALAVDHIHSLGIVHRDIKPANLLFHQRVLKLTDFGIAQADFLEPVHSRQLIGTPGFMPPEQFAGESATARSDLFSLAACLYELLSGKKPFQGDHTSVFYDRVFDRAPMITRDAPDLMPDFDAFFERALARAPEDRFESAAEMGAALSLIVPEHELEAISGLGHPVGNLTGQSSVYGYGQTPRAYGIYVPSKPLREPPPPRIPESVKVDGAVPAPWQQEATPEPGRDFEMISFTAIDHGVESSPEGSSDEDLPGSAPGRQLTGLADAQSRKSPPRPVYGRRKRSDPPLLGPQLPLESQEKVPWPDLESWADTDKGEEQSLQTESVLSTGPIALLEAAHARELEARAAADSGLSGRGFGPSTPGSTGASAPTSSHRAQLLFVAFVAAGLALALGLLLGARLGAEPALGPELEVLERGARVKVLLPLQRLPEQVELEVKLPNQKTGVRPRRVWPTEAGSMDLEWATE